MQGWVGAEAWLRLGGGRWTHVAMVMECRGRGGTQASASLLVAGKEAASGSLKFPTLPEPRLKNTMLRLGESHFTIVA